MQLAKNVIDVGLSTNNLEPMLRFWQQDVAIRFDHVLPVRRGQKQYRHDEQGSVIKLNHHAEPLPEAAPSGYRELMIARQGLPSPRRMVDPDGNRVQLVPPGHDGVTQLGQEVPKRDLVGPWGLFGRRTVVAIGVDRSGDQVDALNPRGSDHGPRRRRARIDRRHRRLRLQALGRHRAE